MRSLDAINSLSGSAEKQPVMVVVSMTSARHAAWTRVIGADWCWLYIS